MTVKQADSVPREVVRAGTGASIQILIGPDEAPNFAMRRFTMEPGGGIPAHTSSTCCAGGPRSDSGMRSWR